MYKAKLLIVEDDDLLASSITNILTKDYECVVCSNYNDAYALIGSTSFDLLLLDITFKNDSRTGLDLFKRLREDGIETPAVFITGKDSINYKIGAFKAGADDYICKPFNALELRARVHAVLKRSNKEFGVAYLDYGDLRIDLENYTAYKKNKPLKLRRKEFALLEFLVRNNNKVLSREKLLDSLWDTEEPVENNTLDVHIKNLRSKVGHDLIKTVYGIGYKLA